MSKKNNYQQASFWEQRYKQSICQWYQWLATPNQCADLIHKYVPQGSNIVQLGCGSSNLAEKLITMHYQSVTCLDFSKQIVKNKAKHAKDGVSYKVHDITQTLPFDDQTLDVIIQKNTIDCLFCYQDYPARVMRVMKDCFRVLKDGGIMVSISHGKQKMRRFFYRNRFAPFNIKVVPLSDLKPSQSQIYMYVLTKGDVQDQNNQANDEEIEPKDEGEAQQNKIIAQAQNEQEEGVEEEPQQKQIQNKEQQQQQQKQQQVAAEEQNYEFDELDAQQS